MSLPRIAALFVPLLLASCGPPELVPDAAIDCERCADWNAPHPPFRVHGKTWYVGTDGLSAILIESDTGLVLIDGGLPQSAELIAANIRELGFDPRDIRAILVSHAHYDHAGGVAALQRLSGANVFFSNAGSETLRSGRLQPGDPQYGAGPDDGSFPPVRSVVAVGDGEVVTVGALDIRAVYTPGHTAGGVTWTWASCAMNRCYDVVYADSLTPVSAEGFSFAASGAADLLVESAGIIGDLDCDILLTPHPFFFGMHDKLERRGEGNPFINPVSCLLYAEASLDWIQQRLDAERP